jgi:hypothetical protein
MGRLPKGRGSQKTCLGDLPLFCGNGGVAKPIRAKKLGATLQAESLKGFFVQYRKLDPLDYIRDSWFYHRTTLYMGFRCRVSGVRLKNIGIADLG